MAYAIIENNIVINVVEAEEELALAKGWVEIQGGAGIGWTYSEGKFTLPPAPEPVVEPQPTKEELLAQLQALQAQIESLGE